MGEPIPGSSRSRRTLWGRSASIRARSASAWVQTWIAQNPRSARSQRNPISWQGLAMMITTCPYGLVDAASNLRGVRYSLCTAMRAAGRVAKSNRKTRARAPRLRTARHTAEKLPQPRLITGAICRRRMAGVSEMRRTTALGRMQASVTVRFRPQAVLGKFRVVEPVYLDTCRSRSSSRNSG